jgi:fructoselysine-6-P-deglycase FrlB-like protein
MPERDTKVEYENWTTEVLLPAQTYYAATATTKGYNEDQPSYDKAIKGPEAPLWKQGL